MNTVTATTKETETMKTTVPEALKTDVSELTPADEDVYARGDQDEIEAHEMAGMRAMDEYHARERALENARLVQRFKDFLADELRRLDEDAETPPEKYLGDLLDRMSDMHREIAPEDYYDGE